MFRLACLWLILVPLALLGCDDGASGVSPDDADGGDTTPSDSAPADAAPADAAPPDAMPPDAMPPDAMPGPAFCEGPTAQRYDPFGSTELEVFPDDLLTRPDAESPTGLRLDLSRAGWFERMPNLFRGSLEDSATLSGFGHNGSIVLRFTGPLAIGADTIETSTADDALMLFDLDADPPTRVPYSIRRSEGDAALIVQPARPLRAGARHGLVLTTAALDVDGGCIAPSPALRELLTDTADDPRMAALSPVYAALLDAADVGPHAVSAATVFTTHREFEVLEAIAADLGTRPARWAIEPECERSLSMRRCEGVVEAWDYRDERAILSSTPSGTWMIPVTLYLPRDAETDWPALMMGHGLGSSRAEAFDIARRWGRDDPNGPTIIVSVDALGHGDHPTAPIGVDYAEAVMGFLGLSLAGLEIDGRTLTGNFEQTVLDRLQVLDLMRREPDLDGDGIDDVQTDRLGYFGISLGGLLGPALLALDPTISAAVLQVPGGHLSQIATSSEPVEMFMPLIINLFGSEDRFVRLLPLLQAMVDRADPATWAVRAMQRPGGPPHVLMQVSTLDEIVPPPTGIALARALGLPHMGEIVEPVPLLEPMAAPATRNLPGGATGGFTQFDRVSFGPGGTLRPSSHTQMPGAWQVEYQVEAFLDPWTAGDVPVLVDPYGELDTPPLD